MRDVAETREELEIVRPDPAELRRHMGEWVAVDADGRVRAAGRSFDEVAKDAAAGHVEDPEFLYVPAHGFTG